MIKQFSLVFFLVFSIGGWQAYRLFVDNDGQRFESGWLPSSKAKSVYQSNKLITHDTDSSQQIALAGKISHAEIEPKGFTENANERHQSPSPRPVNLNSLSTVQLWHEWESLLSQAQVQQLPIITSLIAEKMHNQADPVVYQNIAQLLAKSDIPLTHKVVALDLLSELATPKSLNLLIDLAEKSTNSPLFFFVLQAISRIGDNRWDGRFHEELSPILEQVWANPNIDDNAFISAIGQALSSIGATQGVESLLSTLSAGKNIKVTNPVSRIKQEVAFQVVPQISNPGAVDVLTRRLEQEPLDSPIVEITGAALAGISTPEATEKLIDWATQASAENARTLESWLPKINDAESITLITNLQSRNFESIEIQGVFTSYATSEALVNAGSDTGISPIPENK